MSALSDTKTHLEASGYGDGPVMTPMSLLTERPGCAAHESLVRQLQSTCSPDVTQQDLHRKIHQLLICTNGRTGAVDS